MASKFIQFEGAMMACLSFIQEVELISRGYRLCVLYSMTFEKIV